jgi:hypothetical protein
MSTRSEFFRDVLVAAFGICVVIALLVVAGLWVIDALTWVWFGRLLLVAALGMGLVGGLVLARTLRGQRVRRSGYGLIGSDRTAGCTAVVLIVFVVFGLLACGGLMEWLFEFR